MEILTDLMKPQIKVGVLSCSGEECLGGTLSRLATRKLMEKLRPGKAVTLCLPLYIAGGEEERDFANKFPVIAVEGCRKGCVAGATRKFSGADVRDTVVVSDIIGDDAALSKTVSARDLTDVHYKMVDEIAAAIAAKLDAIMAG